MREQSKTIASTPANPLRSLSHLATIALASSALLLAATLSCVAQQTPAAEKPLPALDLSSMDLSVDPCTDMYKYACGKFNANHPIPSDQSSIDPFYVLYNVNTQELNTILEKAEAGGPARSPDEQKIGDYFKACMNTDLIQSKGLAPIQPLLDKIDALSGSPSGRAQLAGLIGELQRHGVNAFFGFGEQQDFQDATKQIAEIAQGGLGLPEKTYHLQPIATFTSSLPGFNFAAFEDAIHSPHVAEINNSTPQFWPETIKQMQTADISTIKAYLRYQLLTTTHQDLPKEIDFENFDFYYRILNGQPEQHPRWKRCSSAVDGAIGEALGKVYVEHYFAGDSKAKMLQMVHDIEASMSRDLDQIDWMSPATKVRAREKLAAVANKIGYPDKWRDYSKLIVKPDDALGNTLRATDFENDRELDKIGKPVDRSEWGMSPPTVNAYYNPSMNDINFPAGILQSPFYDRTQDDAVNYGHIGGVIGHELTHGFDDEGRKFDAKGNLADWWTPEDLKKFEIRTDCEVKEYGSFTAVDDIKVNGKLTLGENTADNGGLLLAFMAYMQRVKDDHVDLTAKKDGLTGPQRFYIAWAQNWCQNTHPEAVRSQALADPHSPNPSRVNGVVVNQPGFAPAFNCKQAAPMVPTNSCRVW
jgi:predicted metalloendopeptidase